MQVQGWENKMKIFFILTLVVLVGLVVTKDFYHYQKLSAPSATVAAPSALTEESKRISAREQRDRHINEWRQAQYLKAMNERAERGEGQANTTGP